MRKGLIVGGLVLSLALARPVYGDRNYNIDVNGDGRVSWEEMYNGSQDAIEERLKGMDFEQYGWSKEQVREGIIKDIRRQFKEIDSNDDGFITEQEGLDYMKKRLNLK